MSARPKIAVVGSLNIDYFVRVDRFPEPGETVTGRELEIRFGGKGANQAVAAQRLGAEVAMIGAIGDDEMAGRYRERLQGFGIDVDRILGVEGAATGSAFINVDRSAENTIVVAPGANGRVSAADVEANADRIAAADVLLLQNEVPHEANLAAAKAARAGGAQVIYNPAPWDEGRDVAALAAGLLVVNEVEAKALAKLGGFLRMVITRGAASTLAKYDSEGFEVPTVEVEPVDTVGAGDAFVGALGVALAEGKGFEAAVCFANRVAAQATLKLGAQEAMPTREMLSISTDH